MPESGDHEQQASEERDPAVKSQPMVQMSDKDSARGCGPRQG